MKGANNCFLQKSIQSVKLKLNRYIRNKLFYKEKNVLFYYGSNLGLSFKNIFPSFFNNYNLKLFVCIQKNTISINLAINIHPSARVVLI